MCAEIGLFFFAFQQNQSYQPRNALDLAIFLLLFYFFFLWSTSCPGFPRVALIPLFDGENGYGTLTEKTGMIGGLLKFTACLVTSCRITALSELSVPLIKVRLPLIRV